MKCKSYDLVLRTEENLKAVRGEINKLFNNYDIYNCMSAKEQIKKYLKNYPELRKEFSWLERELGISLN